MDVGSSSDGLVHISHLSSEFVASVADVLAPGQAVTVRVLSCEPGAGRLALSMLPEGSSNRRGGGRRDREADDGGGGGGGGGGEGGDAPTRGKVATRGKAAGPRGDRSAETDTRPPINVKKGEEYKGTVVGEPAPYGIRVELEGQGGLSGVLSADMSDGPLPSAGAEVTVRIVSVDTRRRRIDLTTRSAEDLAAEAEVKKTGVVAGGEVPSGAYSLHAALVRAGVSPASFPRAASEAAAATPPPTAVKAVAAAAPAVEALAKTPAAAADAAVAEPTPKVAAPAAAAKKADAPVAAPAGGAAISAATVKALREQSGAGMMDCKKALAEAGGDMAVAAAALRAKGLASADKKAGRLAAEGAVVSYIHAGSRLGVLLEVNCETDFVARGDDFKALVSDLAMQVAASGDCTVVAVDDLDAAWVAAETAAELAKEDIQSKPPAIREKMVAGRVEKLKTTRALLEQPFIKDTDKTVGTVVKEAVARLGENIKVRRFVRFNLGEGLEQRSTDLAAEVAEQTAAMAAAAAARKEKAVAAAAEESVKEEATEAKPTVAVSAATVKALRDQSGAGMMDCKKALAENGGDMEAAAAFLRAKGLASADKKAGRVAGDGAVGAYIHAGSRLGVLIEVNCETDFVARGDAFKALVADLAMQVAACSDVTCVSVEDVDPAFLAAQREAEAAREDLLSKPEAIRAKIVEGRVAKIATDAALLEQPFIKDTDVSVGDHVKACVAAVGENIQVRRFVRFNLGEGLEKRVDDFAAEVAAQTGGKA